MPISKTRVAFASLAIAAGVTYAAIHGRQVEPVPSAAGPENADAVRKSIAKAFSDFPHQFDLPKAALQLGNARLEGFAVCSNADEASAAQYVEVAQMIDQAQVHTGAFQKLVNGVMDASQGMSDCDFRVLSVIARVTAAPGPKRTNQ